MPIEIECPHCSARFRIADTMRGKRVRCPKCEEVVDVDRSLKRSGGADDAGITAAPGRSTPRTSRRDDDEERRRPRDEDDDERPRRRPRDDDEDDERPARRRRRDKDEERRGPPWPLIIGGAAGGAVLLVVAIVLIVVFSQNPNPVQPVAQNEFPHEQVNQPPANNNVGQKKENNKPANNPPQQKPQNNQPVDNAGKPQPKQPIQLPEPKANEPPPVVWSVKADPPANPMALPANPRGAVPLPTSANILFPRGASPFVALGDTSGGFQVWNMHTGQKTGGIGRVQLNDVSLSPDGKYLAGKVSGLKAHVEVISCSTGQPAQRVIVEEKYARITLVDFAGPDELVTVKGVFGKNEWKIWDVRTGQQVRQFVDDVQSFEEKMVAFSPGRRYVAMPGKDHKVVLYDLTTGQQTGSLAYPEKEGFSQWRCSGLAFAPDGSELAGAFTLFDKASIVSWNIADGKVAVNHPYATQQLERSIKGSLGAYQGQALDWLADRSGWLAFGHLLIDRDSGGIMFTTPAAQGQFAGADRRMIGKYHLALLSGDFKLRQFQIVPLPKDQIEAGLLAAKKDADPNAGKLPNAISADWSAVQQLPPPAGGVAWTVQSDPAAAPKTLATRPIPLQVQSGEIADVAFSDPLAYQAAVLSADTPTGRKTFFSVDRHELATGKHLGRMQLFGIDDLKQRAVDSQLSPDGSRLVLLAPVDKSRIDVWSLSDSKHLTGWVPNEKEPDKQVRAVAWIDSDHLLTHGVGNGRLTLWQVPQCKAIWSTSHQGSDLALSPGRKYVAVFNGATFELLETKTGKRCGQLASPGVVLQTTNAIAFSSDGKTLAAFVQPGSLLARWDLATGELEAADAIQPYFLNEMRWCSPKHLVAETLLIDLNLKGILWQYMLPPFGKAVRGSPDGRVWFTARSGRDAPAVLAAHVVPDPQALKFSAELAAGQVNTLFGPNKRVRLQINGGDGDFQTKVTQALTATLSSMKLNVASDGELALTIQLDERDTGQKLELRSIGGGGKNFSVPIMEVSCKAMLTDNGGRTLWEQSNKYMTPSQVFGILRTEDPLQHYRDQLWGSVRSWAFGVRPPGLIVDVGNQPKALPISSTLGGP